MLLAISLICSLPLKSQNLKENPALDEKVKEIPF